MKTWDRLDIRTVSDEEYTRAYALMQEDKRARVARLRRAEDQKRSIAADLLVRRMLSDRCGIPAEQIVIKTAENGKPYACDLPVHFSISHAGDYAVCAVSDTPVGIDVERIRPVDPAVFRQVCTGDALKTEETVIRDESALRLFFEEWTRREAVFKCGDRPCTTTYPAFSEGYVLCIAHKD